MGARVPILVNCRDRVSCLEVLVTWLESAGHERIVMVDNASTYPPLLEYYEQTPHEVVRLSTNVGHLAPWTEGVVDRFADGPYVVTDPDVVPTEECPKDAVDRLVDLLGRHSDVCKVGLGLVIDDIPEHYRFSRYVRGWEAQHWVEEVEPGIFSAPVDTTFAAYRPGAPFAREPALRTGPPYMARHLAWYVNSAVLSEEERYYRKHARPNINTWNQTRLPIKLDGYFHRSSAARLRRVFRKGLRRLSSETGIGRYGRR